jgi:transcriptional regulator with XRE-family HTH domain
MDTVELDEQLEQEYTDEEIEEIKRESAFDYVDAQLKELREERGLTQKEMAERMNVSQPQLSKFENSDDFYLSTLRRYVEALDAELELKVKMGQEMRRLSF